MANSRQLTIAVTCVDADQPLVSLIDQPVSFSITPSPVKQPTAATTPASVTPETNQPAVKPGDQP